MKHLKIAAILLCMSIMSVRSEEVEPVLNSVAESVANVEPEFKFDTIFAQTTQLELELKEAVSKVAELEKIIDSQKGFLSLKAKENRAEFTELKEVIAVMKEDIKPS